MLVEDHPLFRQGLRASLAELDGVRVVGEAAGAAQALTLARDCRPDVVLMDLDLGDGSGIDVTAALTAHTPGVAVLVLTMHDAEPLVFAALSAGACGYLLKGADQAEIERAVRGAAAGEAVFGAGVARRVLARLQGEPSRGGPLGSGGADSALTDREREILDLMAEGWGNQEIAERLFLAPKTVRNNVSAILAKLHAANRGEAIVKARGWGYGQGTSAPGEK
jgi:DNA-binding NarL/FixJ family response regulator